MLNTPWTLGVHMFILDMETKPEPNESNLNATGDLKEPENSKNRSELNEPNGDNFWTKQTQRAD